MHTKSTSSVNSGNPPSISEGTYRSVDACSLPADGCSTVDACSLPADGCSTVDGCSLPAVFKQAAGRLL